MTDQPAISVCADLDTGVFNLYVTSYGETLPAGPRLFRAPPHPNIQFVHDDPLVAEAHAEILRRYLAALPQPKAKKKSGARGAFVD